MLIHSVYFWLQPSLTEVQKAEFRAGLESLKGIRAVEQVYIGTPAAVPDRPIIDKSFAFALTIVCKDVAAHDAYQTDPIHVAFVTTFKPWFAKVQIYDAE